MKANRHLLNLRLWWYKNKIFIREYGNICDRLIIDEAGKVKVKLDPKIRAIEDKLIYSDYIVRNSLRFGYEKNKAIENVVKRAAEAKRLEELTDQPTYSIALKYLTDDVNVESKKEEKDVEDCEPILKPIYMPYAATDEFKSVEIENDNEEEISQPLMALNEKYQNLYESHLTAKLEAEKLHQNDIKNLETRISEMERRTRRPTDNIKKIPSNWMKDYEQFDDLHDESWESVYGTPNPKIPVSSIGCGGCGALLQCQDPAIPGYLPSELFIGMNHSDLKNTICQRCHFMKYYNTTLEVTVSPDAYPQILSNIKLNGKKAAVILMIDLTDFPCSIWPNLNTIIGKHTPIFVVGNKIDLLPRDCPRFVENVEKSLLLALKKSGFAASNIKHVALISAKTGYGVERLINKLHKIWKYKGDVYMIGCTNVGKSTLFNALLQSDYCKVQAVDLIQRATISPWPGTTLNLLKFPILNPLPWRLYQRTLRQASEQNLEQAELDTRNQESRIKRDVTFATLQGRIGRTFPRMQSNNAKVMAAYEASRASGKFGINENNEIYKLSRWCYDTPGVIHPDQVLHLLTTDELLLTLSKKIISPRSFIFKPGQTMFLAGLGRIDLISGPTYIRITVFASQELPITICHTENADFLYNELLYTEAFAVPVNDPERLKIWPSLQSKEFSVEGIGEDKSVADILLSSAGWVAITADKNEQVNLRAWTPEGRGLYLRKPALLSKSIILRGGRIMSSPAYKYGRQVYIKN